VSGGGARSALWLRIVASALDLPLEVTAVEEGSAYGAALLAGVAAGAFASTDEAVARCVRVRERVEPDPSWRDAYGGAYARFADTYAAIRPLTAPAPAVR
jgi:xylulokinase